MKTIIQPLLLAVLPILLVTSCGGEGKEEKKELSFEEKTINAIEDFEGKEIGEIIKIDTFDVERSEAIVKGLRESEKDLEAQQERIPALIDSAKVRVEQAKKDKEEASDMLKPFHDEIIADNEAQIQKLGEMKVKGKHIYEENKMIADFIEKALDQTESEIGYYVVNIKQNSDTTKYGLTTKFDVLRFP